MPESLSSATCVVGAGSQQLMEPGTADRQGEAGLQAALVDAEKRAAVAESQLADLQAARARGFWLRLFGG